MWIDKLGIPVIDVFPDVTLRTPRIKVVIGTKIHCGTSESLSRASACLLCGAYSSAQGRVEDIDKHLVDRAQAGCIAEYVTGFSITQTKRLMAWHDKLQLRVVAPSGNKTEFLATLTDERRLMLAGKCVLQIFEDTSRGDTTGTRLCVKGFIDMLLQVRIFLRKIQ